jgi:CspA family cold shock protein
MGENGRETGVVKWFNDKKEYGFLSRASREDVFVHHFAIIAERFRSLAEGDQVEFAIQQDQRGQAAVDVCKI